MRGVIFKSAAVAAGSAAASLLLAATIVPAIGGVVDGNAWLMSTVLPVVIAWPASAVMFWQSARFRAANQQLAKAHAELLDAHRQLAEKASRDHMTGMLNRESFFAALDQAQRESGNYALLIIDADNFKMINDRFGHLAGDLALTLIAAAIKEGVRERDTRGRVGGEEFAILLSRVTANELAAIAERILAKVAEIRFEPVEGKVVSLSVSIGGASCWEGGTSDDLWQLADRRLYVAKRSGRNTTVMSDPPLRSAMAEECKSE
ncbi:MAG: GGDEF domain-containing protein [Chelatococcus sp.]|uniref:GGDEF domain-containing protein n=1 Tax=unclassified Chelatococcus TaxID=2638111 RepID=UPI001BCB4861|nr:MULTISPECIES: GGDEF domain-containing protein [unclassified Chelatococcus]CAH1652742.1 GGDEF domain-containing protein [Hyphomicrobiales bacterium]MBS7742993.1 GGDEF domain-containing protein [Chelatococcus sp. HY11]MBX3538895.1 GGDEF domain-containing protein [Chelatococcus sp.]MBX3541889.1 GGDEF domain-containing protein [Chelatococcus sp.]MCO5074220.1 GGDEF domain-containing protein [Chelatococcus sp.]